MVDDLAVARSWMLPAGATTVAELWSSLRSSLTDLLSVGRLPCRVALWSQLVTEERYDYEAEVARVAARCKAGTIHENDPLRTAFGDEIAKRRRFERATGRGDHEEMMRRRAADQVANYAVQGRLLRMWGLGAYLAWNAEELALMTTVDPEFAALVLEDTYDASPSRRRDPWNTFPAGFDALRAELRLYVDDLERTPGRVQPGLADTLLDAVAQLLTPGTRPAAARQIRAFNRVLSAGQVNRARVGELLEEALRIPARPGPAMEQTIKKLFCQLSSRYTDADVETEYTRHMGIVHDLAQRLPSRTREHVALALTGSLAQGPTGMWHPFFSDIDVMPLFSTPPHADLLTAVRTAYTVTPRPPWLYLNEGAKQGLAGLTHDPVQGLFVASRLHMLTNAEYGKLSRLVTPMRHVGGSHTVYADFTNAYRHRRHVRAQQMSEGDGDS